MGTQTATMAYVSGGQMLDNQSPWRLNFIPELFWGLINFFVLFFRTLVNPGSNSKGSDYSTEYRVGNQGPFGPGGGPQRRMGGFRRGGGGAGPPPMAGGG